MLLSQPFSASLLQLGALAAATCMQAITSIASCVGEKPDIEKKLRESGVSDSQSCTDMVALMTSNRTFFLDSFTWNQTSIWSRGSVGNDKSLVIQLVHLQTDIPGTSTSWQPWCMTLTMRLRLWKCTVKRLKMHPQRRRRTITTTMILNGYYFISFGWLYLEQHVRPTFIQHHSDWLPIKCPKSRFLRSDSAQAKHLNHKPSTIGTVMTLKWNAVSQVNISIRTWPTDAEPPEQSMLQVRECLDKVKICIEKHKNAAQTAKKNIVTWSDYIVTWSDYNMIFGGMLASSTCIKRTPQNNFLRGLHRTSKFTNISISLACKRQLKPKTEKWAAWAIHSRDVDAACTGIVQTPGDFPIPYQDEMVLLGNSSYS